MKMLTMLAVFGLMAAGFARGAEPAAAAKGEGATGEETKVPVTITGGHDTDPRDHGRPVVLIAAALKVPSEVFRETFTHVKPASGGREPEPEQVRKNKQALMEGLSKYGVTNDRLDAVSNYYRYNGRRGEMWRNAPATAVATVKDGKVVSITVTNAGAGYTSEPKISDPGVEGAEFKVELAYGTEFEKNGSIKEITPK